MELNICSKHKDTYYAKQKERKMSSRDLKLGQKVRITGMVDFRYQSDNKKLMRKLPAPKEGMEGIVVMKTYKYEGYMDCDSEYDSYFVMGTKHDVYLVAYSLRRIPIMVLPEQVIEIEEKDK